MRLVWSWRRAPRPMSRPSATTGVEAALGRAIWDANLGLAGYAAQEFRFIDERHAEGFRLFELRSGVGAHDERGRFLRYAVGDAPPGRLDQLGGPLAGEGGQRPGDDVGLPVERSAARAGHRLLHRQAEVFEPLDQLAVPRLGEESGHGLRDSGSDAADRADLLYRRVRQRLHGPEVPGEESRALHTHVPDAEREQQDGERLPL